MLIKRRLVLVVFALFAVLSSFACATDVSLTGNSTYAIVNIEDALNLYAYEVNLDYSGSSGTPVDAKFLGASNAAGASSSVRGSILSVYDSRLDSARAGASGDGNLFNISHSGTATLRYAVFIDTDGDTEYVYYNKSAAPICGNGVCETGEGCSSCSGDCGICSSTSGGGTGGGGASEKATPKAIEGLSLDTTEISINLVMSSTSDRIVRVENKGAKTETITVRQQNLDSFVSFDETLFTLAPGEVKDVRVVFSGTPAPGIYTGKIMIGGNDIFVSVNIRSKELLFDALVAVPESGKVIKAGNKLEAQITLVPMGEEGERLDVTINYVIKDFAGNTYLKESETILVSEQKSYMKEFYTTNLPPGNYVIGIEVVYPNGMATSSSHFEIQKISEFNAFSKLNIFLYVLITLLLVLVIFVVAAMVRYKNKKKRGRKKNEI